VIDQEGQRAIKPSNSLKEMAHLNTFDLKIYHSKFDNYQIQYFNKKELEYYRKILKNEEQTQGKKQKQKAINCQEDKLLGCGSFGTVTLGYDVNNLRIMAVKRVYIGSFPENSAALKEIKEESKLLSELKHKNIVTYFGSERENEFLKIYMEFVEGGSIASLIKTYGPFHQQVAARYTRQILQGLEYLHYHNVVHRDIKGANVLVTRNGRVKLSDFGSAKRICSYEQSMIGTIAWMAPEVD
jgi:serine/threonine protein kinase